MSPAQSLADLDGGEAMLYVHVLLSTGHTVKGKAPRMDRGMLVLTVDSPSDERWVEIDPTRVVATYVPEGDEPAPWSQP